MQIAVAQIKSSKGDPRGNLLKHLKILNQQFEENLDVLFFPELSVTGYEPTIAKKINFNLDDAFFYPIKSAAEKKKILVGIGAPLNTRSAPLIAQIMFHPDGSVSHYSKKYLHPDETPFFDMGVASPTVILESLNIGLAICYEISQDEHIADLFAQGADMIIAPVAKSFEGTIAAHYRLSEIAKKYSTPVLMSNCVGPSDNFLAAGQSAVWGPDGQLLQMLGEKEEGILILDTVEISCEKIVI